MGAFDWLRGLRRPPPDPTAWQVRREGDRLVVADGRKDYSFAPRAARSVRVVPLGASPSHETPHGGSGWQVAVRRDDGDVLVGPPIADWRAARDFAQRLCEAAELPMDELSAALFRQPDARRDAGA